MRLNDESKEMTSFKKMSANFTKFTQNNRVFVNSVFGVLLVFCLLFLLGGWLSDVDDGQNSIESLGSPNNTFVSDMASSSKSVTTESSGDVVSGVPFDASKIIYSGDLTLSVSDYSETLQKITTYVRDVDGFVQNSTSNYVSSDSSLENNGGHVIVRVPSEKFDDAMSTFQTWGKPVSVNVDNSNISQQYNDVQAELNNLKIEEGRLLEYLKQSTNITDMLTIEKELNRIRTAIDSSTTIINGFDTDVQYSTINVSLTEKQLSDTSIDTPFSEINTKISEGFLLSINLILQLVASLIVLIFKLIPFVIVFGLGFGCVLLFKRKKR